MSKLQEYFIKKKMQKFGNPAFWVVKSTPEGVDSPILLPVVEVVEKSTSTDYKMAQYPYDVTLKIGETSGREDGYGTGCGDLWSWTYYYSLSQVDANNHFITETNRVTKKYFLV